MSTWMTKFVLATRRIAGSLSSVARPRAASILLLALCSICATQLYAADGKKAADSDKDAELLVSVLAAPDTVYTHPDLWYRSLGSSSYKEGFAAEAFTFFLRASRYADKPSQAIVATMYWQGDGVATDRPLAYAWMDLAADRGYPELIVQRERYWKELTPDERVKALQVGHAVYAEYNDVKGAERLNGLLRRVSTQVTGSHTGFVGTMGVLLGSGPFSAQITNPFRLQKTYQEALWNTADYLRMKDLRWLGPDRMGRVTVGRLEAVPSPDQPKIPDSVAPSPGK